MKVNEKFNNERENLMKNHLNELKNLRESYSNNENQSE
jgi:hypothetical protein